MQGFNGSSFSGPEQQREDWDFVPNSGTVQLRLVEGPGGWWDDVRGLLWNFGSKNLEDPYSHASLFLTRQNLEGEGSPRSWHYFQKTKEHHPELVDCLYASEAETVGYMAVKALGEIRGSVKKAKEERVSVSETLTKLIAFAIDVFPLQSDEPWKEGDSFLEEEKDPSRFGRLLRATASVDVDTLLELAGSKGDHFRDLSVPGSEHKIAVIAYPRLRRSNKHDAPIRSIGNLRGDLASLTLDDTDTPLPDIRRIPVQYRASADEVIVRYAKACEDGKPRTAFTLSVDPDWNVYRKAFTGRVEKDSTTNMYRWY